MGGFPARPETVLLIGVDNANAVCWIVKGEPRGKSDRKMSGACFWRLKQNVEAAVFYLRTNRKVADGVIRRLPEDRLHGWGRGKNWNGDQYVRNGKFLPHLGRIRIGIDLWVVIDLVRFCVWRNSRMWRRKRRRHWSPGRPRITHRAY